MTRNDTERNGTTAASQTTGRGERLEGMTHGGDSIYKHHQSNPSKILMDDNWHQVKPSEETPVKFQVLHD